MMRGNIDFRPRNFLGKSHILFPHEEGDAVFVVSRGRARVYLAYENKEFTLALRDRGDVFGSHIRAFVAALDKQPS